MSETALVLYLAFLLSAFGWRGWVQYRRTGDAGFRLLREEDSPAARVAGLSLGISLLALLAASLLPLLGTLPTPTAAAGALTAGLVLTGLGFVVTIRAQLEMADSWRIGVDPSERTELVTGGLFRVVRNPIFTGIGLFSLGYALLVPNALALLGVVTGALGIELQVRRLEEPYLLQTHGEAYRLYAARVGRFLPGIGRLGVSPRGRSG